MGLRDAFKRQFIEVLAWTEPSDAVLAFRFPVANNEIKDEAQLIVRESQAALFVDGGKPADLFGPGRHSLSSDNLPFLTTLESWTYGFRSPFKCEVYFYSLRQKLGQKWGTRQPIAIRDAELGSLQLRMFGAYSYHIADVRTFYREVSGTRELFTTEELVDQLLPTIVSAATKIFAESKLPFLDLASSLQTLSAALRGALEAPFAQLGLALDSFMVEAVTLPEALQQALHARQQLAIVGDVQRYAQFETARAIAEAAQSPAGTGASKRLAAGAAPDAALVACGACGKDIERGSAFCRFCGKPQPQRCSRCQQAVAAGSAFCAACGHELGA